MNRGYATGIELSAPLGPFMVRADGSFRTADDMGTPLGALINTDLRTLNGSVGASYIGRLGYAGVAFSQYSSDYGIPPDPNGGHPAGVNISLSRDHYETKAELLSNLPGIRRFEARYNRSIYYHQELEKNGTVGVADRVESDAVTGTTFVAT